MAGKAITFEIPGDPKPWQRADTCGKVRYTPPAMADAKNALSMEALAKGVRRIDGPVQLRVIGVFRVPSSASAAKRANLAGSPVEKRPDLDNILKLVGDALEGVAYENDKTVGKVEIMKLWGWHPRTIITVAPWEPTEAESAIALSEEAAA